MTAVFNILAIVLVAYFLPEIVAVVHGVLHLLEHVVEAIGYNNLLVTHS
jgi:hypothetical protein